MAGSRGRQETVFPSSPLPGLLCMNSLLRGGRASFPAACTTGLRVESRWSDLDHMLVLDPTTVTKGVIWTLTRPVPMPFPRGGPAIAHPVRICLEAGNGHRARRVPTALSPLPHIPVIKSKQSCPGLIPWGTVCRLVLLQQCTLGSGYSNPG